MNNPEEEEDTTDLRDVYGNPVSDDEWEDACFIEAGGMDD